MLAHERLAQKDRESMRQIMRCVAERHGFTEADLYVRDRRGPICRVRSEAWSACYHAGFTYVKIASVAGWDHTSVIYGVDRFLNLATAA